MGDLAERLRAIAKDVTARDAAAHSGSQICACLRSMADEVEAMVRILDDAFEIDESGYVCASYDGWEPIPGEKQDMYLSVLDPGEVGANDV